MLEELTQSLSENHTFTKRFEILKSEFKAKLNIKNGHLQKWKIDYDTLEMKYINLNKEYEKL